MDGRDYDLTQAMSGSADRNEILGGERLVTSNEPGCDGISRTRRWLGRLR